MRVPLARPVACAVFVLVLASCSGPENRIGDPEHPNIVLLFADDLGYGDLSSYGHPTIRTPRLDGLASEGIRMTSFYAVAPSCTPSRAALLTGRYPQRFGLPNVLMPASTGGIPEEEITMAEALSDRGYRTMAIGKWHLGHSDPGFLPTQNGFDSYLGLLYSNDMIRPWVQTDAPLELYRDNEPIEHPVDQATLTLRYTEEAVRFIEADGEQPFFLYLAYSMPHLPVNTAPQFRGKSRAGLYGDVIEGIDWSAGQVLDAIERSGSADHTIVVFTSDNGPWLNLPLRMLQAGIEHWDVGSPGLLRGAKADTYEGGMRVPAIIRWPGVVPKHQVSPEPANTMDLYTTLLNAAGAHIPTDRTVDGRDLQALISGTGEAESKPFFYVRGVAVEGVRDGSWKLRLSNHMRQVEDHRDPPAPELFNLDIDPSERTNRAAVEPELVDSLTSLIMAFRAELDLARNR